MGEPSGTPSFSVGSPVAGTGLQAPGGTSSPQSATTTAISMLLGQQQRQPLPKQLTAAIKSCTSLERLAQLCQTHQALLNPIHIAAVFTKLPKLDVVGTGVSGGGTTSSSGGPTDGLGVWMLPAATAQQQQLKQILQQLLARLKLQGCSDHSPRGVANIVWALARLQCAPDAELRAMLLDRFCEQLGSAVPQDISNVLWGVAKLTKEHAAVISAAPGSSSSSPTAGSRQEPGGTSDAVGPLLQQEQVRLMLQHLVRQLTNASVQTISNSLWAVVVLQQEHQWCMCNCLEEVQRLLAVFCAQPQQALPAHIQPIIRCMTQLATTCSNHAGDSWIQWQPPLLQKLLEHLSTQRDQLELHHVSSVLRDVAQLVCLHLQTQQQQQQGMSPSVGVSTPQALSSTSSVPSIADPSAPKGMSPGGSSRHGHGGGIISASSSTASSSSMLGSSLVSQPAAGTGAATAAGEEADEVLAKLAASGGPQDTSSTVLALAMLRPQLQQLGLQPGVAALCSMLPPTVLPQLGPEVGQRLLAVACFSSDAPTACSPTAVEGSADDSGADTPFSLPVSTGFAARIFAQPGEGLPFVPVPLASPGCSSSGSSLASPTEGSPIAAFTALPPPAGAFLPSQLQSGVEAGLLGLQQGAQQAACSSSSNPGHHPGLSNHGVHSSNPGTPQASSNLPGSNPGGGGLEPAGADPAAAAAGGGGDSQEEAAARQLTHNIAYADSVFQLADIFTAHASVMDMIHITACITRLSKVLGTSPSQAAQAAAASLLPQLGNKLLSVLPNANARGIANVLWGYGRLRALPQTQLLPPLVEAFLTQLPNAACRDSAVVLWSLARLSEGQAEPVESTIPPVLLRRLGREILQQLATASQDAAGQQPKPLQQQQQEGTPRTSEVGSKAEGQEGGDASGPPSSRDVSNSLMALARLGFVPEDDTTAAADSRTPRVSGAGGAAAEPSSAAASVSGASESGASALAVQMQGMSLLAPPASAAAAAAQQQPAAGTAGSTASSRAEQLKQLTLPLSQIKAVVDYLLKMAATAKTLDLQETATALKQLGLRELHARVAATVITHHGTAHGPGSGAGGGMHMMQFGGPGGRLGGMQGRSGGMSGGQFGAGVGFSAMLQQQQMQRRPQMGMQAGMYGGGPGGGWGSPGQVAGGQFAGQPAVGYMAGQGPRPAAAGQVLRHAGMVGAPQQQQGYMLAQGGGRQGMQPGFGVGGLAGMAPGAPGVAYGPAAPAGYTVQYAGEQQHPGILQQQQGGAGGAYAPAMQYLLMPQQQGGYYMPQAGPPPPPQLQQGDALMMGMQVMQQQGGDQGPPGLAGAGAVVGQPTQQQYYMQPGTTALLVPGIAMGPDSSGGSGAQQQQPLMLQPMQPTAAGAAAMGKLGQMQAGAGGYSSSTGMLAADVITSTGYVSGDLFLSAPQQQGASSQLQLLQRQAGAAAGLYQQQQQQQMAPGFAAQDPGAVYLQQSQQQQQQQQQQLAVLYGVAGQGQVQAQQQFGAAGQGVGTLVLDQATGLYHLQQ